MPRTNHRPVLLAALMVLSGLTAGLAFGLPLTQAAAAPAGSAAAQAERETLTVVTTEIAPFVTRDGDDADGFYSEVWGEVAAELGVNYEIIWVESFGDLLPTLGAGRADVAVAPLAPTAEREASFDFTSAVITSGPQLGYAERIGSSNLSIFGALLDGRVIRILLFASIGLLLLAHVIWLLERDRAEEDGDFHPTYLRGIWDGIWWSMVTATTVGYGDRTPKSFGGRAVALLTMLLSLVLVGAFVSQVTAVMGEARSSAPFTNLDEVGDRPIGVVAGSSFASYVADSGAETVAFASQDDVFTAVLNGEIDVLVANPFAMSEIAPEFGVVGVGGVLFEEFETFGLPQGSPWREEINMALADLQASGEVEAIVSRWISASAQEQ